MQAMLAEDLISIVKNQTFPWALSDHKPVGIPNTLSKVAEKAILQQFKADFVKELMPPQLGVRVEFAAEHNGLAYDTTFKPRFHTRRHRP